MYVIDAVKLYELIAVWSFTCIIITIKLAIKVSGFVVCTYTRLAFDQRGAPRLGSRGSLG